MGLRRCALLMLGVSGSLLFVVVLLISAYSTYNFGSAVFVTGAPETTAPDTQQDINAQDVFASSHQLVILPTPIEGTTLIAQQMTVYDGPFLEDGSGNEVVGIAALVVYNAGDREILQTGITLQQEGSAGTALCFYGENIPPGKAVLLLERNRRSCEQNEFTTCSGWQVSAWETREPAAYLEIVDTALGAVTVTNITCDTLYDIRLYYKSWLSPPDIYIGGISREVSVSALQPGESATLHPPYYARGYTKIVSVSANSP